MDFINNKQVQRFFPVVTAIALSAGIYTGREMPDIVSSISSFVFVSAINILFVLLVFSYIRIKKAFLISVIIFSFSGIILGFVLFQKSYYKPNEQMLHLESLAEDEDAKLYGTIIEQPSIKDDAVRLLVETDSIRTRNVVSRNNFIVLVNVYRVFRNDTINTFLDFGNSVMIEGKFNGLPRARNPGEFDYGKYLSNHGISSTFTSYGFKNFKVLGTKDENFVMKHLVLPAKKYSLKVIEKTMSGDEAEFMKGLLLGDRSNLSKEVKEDFINAGVAHIIAVSGLNVAYVLIMLNFFLSVLPMNRNIKFALMTISLLFYMLLTGSSPSIVRATIMAIAFLFSRLIERKTKNINFLGLSAIIILLIDPRQLFDSGFILSYTALLSLVLLYPVAESWLNKISFYRNLNDDYFSQKYLKIIINMLAGTFVAQVGMLPVVAIMFEKVSIVSLFANLFAIPASNASLGIGFFTVLFSLISINLAGLFAVANSVFLHIQLEIIRYCANLDFAFIEAYGTTFLFLICYYAGLAFVFAFKNWNFRFKLICLVLIIAFYFLYGSILYSRKNFVVTFIDVGNSSSALITSPQGRSVLINVGSSRNNFIASERNVIPYLKRNRVYKIDELVITSLNGNEFKSLSFFLKNFDVQRIYVPEIYRAIFNTTRINRKFVEDKVIFFSTSTMIKHDEEFRLHLFYDTNNISNRSALAELIIGKERFLFCDSYNLLDDKINQSYLSGEYNVVKVPSTGTFDYTSPEFLIKANPKYLIVSSARERKNRRVSSKVFKRSAEELGMEYLNTFSEGAIIFETDGVMTRKINWK